MTYNPAMDDARRNLLFAAKHIRERRLDDLARHVLHAALMTAVNVWLLNRGIHIKTGYHDMYFEFIQHEHDIYQRCGEKTCDVSTVYLNLGGLVGAECAQEEGIIDDWYESLQELCGMCGYVINLLEAGLI